MAGCDLFTFVEKYRLCYLYEKVGEKAKKSLIHSKGSYTGFLLDGGTYKVIYVYSI